ncbi:RagB/SusD family nutrient uptake outer membrane protein [Pedobacter antarcticus]|uniref:RagB/SusD family nutrient uptake outer membrane protein n=1 Tax=Pedobacter antarcticus TaxID=34086 RepID=UPI002930B103|nr:RagB/SusD family nutrient uptake outer membrane protein [Pedobacter antarcticus]
MKNIIKCLLLASLACFSLSCEKYLDLKPDKSQVVPTTLDDCQALLNNVRVIGQGYPSVGEISSDDYYLPDNDWATLALNEREPYLWLNKAEVGFSEWSSPYNCILIANQVLSVINKINPTIQQQQQWKSIKGAALLLRSFSFYTLTEIFCVPYSTSTASHELGIPIRYTPDISEKVDRGTLQQTFDRILTDLVTAAELLPAVKPGSKPSKSVAMPVKAAAYAALARVCLITGDFTKAYNYADLSLKQHDVLMDFKIIDPNEYFPIPRFNDEVLYEANATGYVPVSYGKVSPELYRLYNNGDLRKTVFFRDNAGNKEFQGTYNQGDIFVGFATDEMYLIRAECSARAGNTILAMADLNKLRESRWDSSYTPVTANSSEEALKLVLLERRRELPFRALRWSDLRRLNKDARFAVTLRRTLEGKEYTLPPNDLRYTLLIPREVLERVDIPQNSR